MRDAGLDFTPESKHIPEMYRLGSVAQRTALLQGLMDTDGYVDSVGGCELSLSCERLAADAVWLIRSLGVKASMSEPPSGYTGEDQGVGGLRWRITFTVHPDRLAVFRLPWKLAHQGLCDDRGVNMVKYVTDIRPVVPVPMRCITVDSPQHLYVAGDGFVVTHNSVELQAIVFGAICRGWRIVIIDPTKGGADFKFAKPYAAAFVDTLQDAFEVTEMVYQDVLARKKVNAQMSVGGWTELPEEMRPIPTLFMVDEAFSLILPGKGKTDEAKEENDGKAQLLDRFGRIAREARSAGVHEVLGAQRPDASVLSGEMRFNLGLRIVLTDFGASATMAFRDPDRIPPLRRWGIGRGVVDHEGQEPQEFQGYFASQEALGAYLATVDYPDAARLFTDVGPAGGSAPTHVTEPVPPDLFRWD